MQTFLPSHDFQFTASCLDYRRLGKQRVEVLQIIRALRGETTGWQNHPAVKMWRGHEMVLVDYGLAICLEWLHRGYKDTCFMKIWQYRLPVTSDSRPDWLGDYHFHRSHQSNLIRKNPQHYGPLFPGVPDDLPYVWPV